MTPQQWCKTNRQWRRIDNIEHAKKRLKAATTQEDRNFWKEVLRLFTLAHTQGKIQHG